MRLGWLLLIVASVSAAELDPREERSVLAHLTVPARLEARRGELARGVVRGHAIMAEFAARHGWRREAAVRSFDAVEVFDDQQLLWKRVLQLNGLPYRPLAIRGLAAGIEGRVLVALAPEAYARTAPFYAALPESWERLLAHEMVHRLHVAILQGDEEGMGPQWFFEGFACLGAGQRIDGGLEYRSATEALAGARDPRSPLAYRRYLAALRYFARRTSVPRLVARAGRSDFERWLLTL